MIERGLLGSVLDLVRWAEVKELLILEDLEVVEIILQGISSPHPTPRTVAKLQAILRRVRPRLTDHADLNEASLRLLWQLQCLSPAIGEPTGRAWQR